MNPQRYTLSGLIAAAYTPMNETGGIRFDQVGPLVDFLVHQGVTGVYIGGSTGEGLSMTTDERKRVAEAFIEHARGRLVTLVHVGHNCLADARELARHAQAAGADVCSAVAPTYFKPATVDELVEVVAHTASAAPELPFYYYHIPHMTGIGVDLVEFLEQAADRIPNLAGVKYTCHTTHEFQACRTIRNGRFDMVWGFDEMLLSGLAAGARAAIGTTFNILTPLYLAVMNAFDEGEMERARALQQISIDLIRRLAAYPFHPATKSVLTRLGVPSGPCRLPLPRISEEEADRLWAELVELGLLDWVGSRVPAETT